MSASATRHRLPLLTASICAVMVLAACRSSVPLLDPTPGPAVVSGTITGTLSGEDGKTAIQGRRITAVNVDTGERQTAITTETGGYTFKVAPGKYRMEIELLPGEAVVKDEGTFTVSKSELQHDVDLRIGVRRESSPPVLSS